MKSSSLRRLLAALLIALGSLSSTASRAADVFALTSPTSHEIVQRNAKNAAAIRVAGSLIPVAWGTTIETRLVTDGKAGEWRLLTGRILKGTFRGDVEVPAGWHRLEVRGVLEGKVIATTAVEPVGVGEIFVVAGQSNSANYGQEKQSPKSGKVVAFDGQRWQLANDPQPGAGGKGGSFMPPLGDALAERFGVPIGFVACGIGATSVREWLPKGATFPNPPTLVSRVQERPAGGWESKGEAYDMFTARMKHLGPNGFRAVLWHQGESDANQKDPTRTLPGKLYREYLEKLIRDSRKDIGWDAPWFVALASYHVPGDEGSPDIRQAQASLWKDGLALEGPDSDAIKGLFRERDGKGVHFSGDGLREHAKQWADKITPWLKQQTK